MTYANIQNYCFKGFTKYSVANTLCLIISNLISWLTDKRILFQWHCHWHCLFQIVDSSIHSTKLGIRNFHRLSHTLNSCNYFAAVVLFEVIICDDIGIWLKLKTVAEVNDFWCFITHAVLCYSYLLRFIKVGLLFVGLFCYALKSESYVLFRFWTDNGCINPSVSQ